MDIYLARNNEQAGPYTLAQVHQMIDNQQVVATDLIWFKGLSEWKTVGEIKQNGLLPPAVDIAQPNTDEKWATPQTNSSQYDWKNNIPVLKKDSTAQGLAPFSKRIFAKIIDLILWLPSFAFLTAFMSPAQHAEMAKLQSQGMIPTPEMQQTLLNIIPQSGWIGMGIYLGLMLAVQAILLSKTGQSIGKKVMQIKIVDAETQADVGLGRIFIMRTLMFIVLNVLFMPFSTIIDLAFSATKKRQTLHDKVAKTIVIEK
ncbi:Uncharacterized membrane protein YckC, RDD family [Acinetobacter marinus]|uniref:Uncharacterized membrane protein YckC, RDD family n=1 Tax=Acinetobacter marinus TaxID=281375 RepID=A0A1G6GTM3_9GAMM|nr:RDD family protein [Acinetobacter marinus]SDB85299.1 Uncharacterized membrane protein YckC, RDD family [Acinetobacter marinus]